MSIRGKTRFHIKGLNQEKMLNKISKETPVFELERLSKKESTFCVEYSKTKDVKSKLLADGFEIVSQRQSGVVPMLACAAKKYGVVVAVFLSFFLFLFQYQYVWQYDVIGTSFLSKNEVVSFVKDNFSNKKNQIETKEIENALSHNFEEISFVSCIIRGQTLVLNIKEKLLPEEIFGQFRPIFAQKSGKITQINLVSGTLLVKVGDFVKEGDVLVEPFVIDSSGEKRKVEANAEIFAEVYNEGSAEHFQSKLEKYRTGKISTKNEVKLFGLTVYSINPKESFLMFETEKSEKVLTKNNLLPFKLCSICFYEIKERLVESKFEDVKEEIIEKSKQNALSKINKRDKITEEYYTIKHLDSVTIVDYCIVTDELIGG